jgi:tetratricopeptide (TPR) repeat protein
MDKMRTQQYSNNEMLHLRQARLPIIPRQQALAEFEAILPLDAPERVLNVHGGGGRGKTWFLWGLQKHCEERGLVHNPQPIDFYDTAHQRAFGVMDAIVQALDPKGEYFRDYLKSGLTREREQRIFLQCLRDLAQDQRKKKHGGEAEQRGIVLMFDTYETVREGRVSRWLLGAFLEAADDIAVVISGRPKIVAKEAKAPIRFCEPGDFSILEIAAYIRETFARYEVPLTQDDISQIAERIYQDSSNGMPVLVALALDVVNLHISTHGIPLAIDSVFAVLDEAERQGDFEIGLIEKAVELLGTRPEQQWALLYMAHLRRRFNEDIYGFLQGKRADALSADLDPFASFYIMKYRQLEGQEVGVLLHDRIRERTHKHYWQGAIPTHMVMRGRQEGLFPPDLDELWAPYCDPEKEVSQIEAQALKPILRWLDSKIIAYCEDRQVRLKAEQDALDREKDFLKWVEYEQCRQTLSAEQLLYELDKDLEEGWHHFRNVYKDAFEAYRHGYCEQLELTVLNAWSKRELSADEPLGPRRVEIQEMVRVRQAWWRIRFGLEARKRAIRQLETLRQGIEKRPEDGCQELLADVMGALGWAYALEGDIGRSITYRERAATLYEKAGLPEERGWALNFLGESYARQGNFHRADRLWEEAIEIARYQEPPNETEIASIIMKRAHYKNLSGELGLALGYSKVAEVLFQKLGDMRRLGSTLNFQGRIYLANERFKHAEEAFRRAQGLFSEYGDPEDEALLQIGLGEFYRRRAEEGDLKQAREHLEQAFKIADSTGYEECKATAQGELGALFRDEAHRLASEGQLDEARRIWRKARGHFEEALRWARKNQTWFLVADFLSDLCDLYADQYKWEASSRDNLDATLEELERVARHHNYIRYLSRVAEMRADLGYKDDKYDSAIEGYVRACEAIGLQTRIARAFRNTYDELVGKIEKRLHGLPAEDQVRLAREAIRLWGQTGNASDHPQLISACQRVLHPAQSQLEEDAADIAFEKGQYEKAFEHYVQACHLIGQRTGDSYENYAHYAKLVSKLERRFFDLENPEDILRYSRYIEEEWHNLGNTTKHGAVLEICQRAQEMALLILEAVA